MERVGTEAGISDESFGPVSMNMALAQKVLEKIVETGVRDILLCAGARNSPLVVLLEKAKGVRIWNFFDERSAAFFALGKAQAQNSPVAVITTSGTAVAELLPAAVEATYTQTPLIFVTADRPRSYRGTGAPQSIDQVGLFFKYVETCLDIASPEEELDLSLWSQTAPLQINVCFDEPLVDGEIPALDFSNSTRSFQKAHNFTQPRIRPLDQPLIIAGALSMEEAEKIAPYLEKLGAPIYAEALSNLRHMQSLQNLFLVSGEKIVRDLFVKGLCLSVLRVGGIPTLRFWRDLEEIFKSVPVVSISRSDYTGLSRAVQHLVGWNNLPLLKSQWLKDPRAQIFSLDQEQKRKVSDLLSKYPRSEAGLLSQLAGKMEADFVYVGNSLPIREWDLVHPYGQKSHHAGNRGANGIDGQISSFLGGSQAGASNWAVVGDLTAMYDLSSLWITNQMDPMKLRLVVINNRGGQIFKGLFGKDIFLNSHQLEFSHWAQMFKWDYQQWSEIPMSVDLPEKVIVEINPSSQESELFWQEYKTI